MGQSETNQQQKKTKKTKKHLTQIQDKLNNELDEPHHFQPCLVHPPI